MNKPKEKKEERKYDPPPLGIGRSTYPSDNSISINEWMRFIRAQNDKIRKQMGKILQ